MDTIPESVLREFHRAQSFVSISRDKIDRETIQGFIIDFDHEWLMIHQVYDFFIDSIRLLRISTITALQSKTIDVFQKTLLSDEGQIEKIAFDRSIPEGGIIEMLKSFDSSKVIIFEEESLKDGYFYIGFIEKITKKHIHIREFSGAARRDDEATKLKMSDATSVSFDGNYTLFYERYFLRQKHNAT